MMRANLNTQDNQGWNLFVSNMSNIEKMKHLNIILANAPINNGNRGCVALSITSLYLIDKVLSDKGYSYTVYLPDSYFFDNKEHIVKILNKEIRFFDCAYPPINKKQLLKEFVKRLLKGHCGPSSTVFDTCDYIFDIGQGDSFSDIYGEVRFNLIYQIHRIAQKKHKLFCLLPQTIGPFNDWNIKRLADQSLSSATLCLTRDKQSYDYVVNNALGQKNICELIDVAFFLPYQHQKFDSTCTHVGINISALLWNGGYTRNNQFGLICDYQHTVRVIIDYFLSLPNTKVHLVPHVVLSERNVENDYEISADIVNEYKNPNLILAPFFWGPIEAKSYISGLDFFMGARMHSTIAAFSSGVPVVPMAYSRKFNGLYEDTLDYHFMADMKKLSEKEILEIIKDGFWQKDNLKQIIKQRMDTIVKDRERLLVANLTHFFNL